MHTGRIIKAIRTRLGLLQQDLADALEVSVTTVSLWESEQTAPYPKRLKRLNELIENPDRYHLSLLVAVGIEDLSLTLTRLRILNNYTLEQLADKSGLPVHILDAFEKGTQLPVGTDWEVLETIYDIDNLLDYTQTYERSRSRGSHK